MLFVYLRSAIKNEFLKFNIPTKKKKEYLKKTDEADNNWSLIYFAWNSMKIITKKKKVINKVELDNLKIEFPCTV